MNQAGRDSTFSWPGEEGFKDFPKHLSEDCIEYTIHVISNASLSDAQVRSRLQEIRTSSTQLVKKYLADYIWQREPFSLELVLKPGGGFLRGKTSYGDSIADEWLIVYLMRELSIEYADAWIRMSDADGEFLLIEAANVLPRWVNPEIAEHRVWMNGGKLYIIPLEKGNAKQSKNDVSSLREISLKQALSFIRDRRKELIHSPQIQEEALYRLRNYPTQIQDSLHTARITIPRKLAYILHAAPAHISPASEAFYLRDPISVQPLRDTSSAIASLKFPPVDLVKVSTKFTRVGYAQLKSQEFPAPSSWSEVPSVSSDASTEMGMKVACAFEMLMADPHNKDKRAVREIDVLLGDLEDGESLPSDKKIQTWPQTEDDEKWLDVNFEDFEAELAGRSGSTADAQNMKGNTTADKPAVGGFGDKAAQENLRKIVENFESFLNDEDAGMEGAEWRDEMDDDDDDDDDDEEGSISSGEDHDASFDQEEFEEAMRQMMGLPPGTETNEGARFSSRKTAKTSAIVKSDRIKEVEDSEDEDEDEDDEEEIRQLSQRMEAELRASGALSLDPGPSGAARIGNGKSPLKGGDEQDQEYHLLKNFLESFKGQGGMAGPAGNMMKMMGVDMPRDDDNHKGKKR